MHFERGHRTLAIAQRRCRGYMSQAFELVDIVDYCTTEVDILFDSDLQMLREIDLGVYGRLL